MKTYEEISSILNKTLDYIKSKYDFNLSGIKHIKILMDDIDDPVSKYWEELPFGMLTKQDEHNMQIYINSLRISNVLKVNNPNIPNIDNHILVQLILTMLHELTHRIVPTNLKLYKNDKEYFAFIEAQVNEISCQMLILESDYLSDICEIDPVFLLYVAAHSRVNLVFPYLIQRGLPIDFNICERVDTKC